MIFSSTVSEEIVQRAAEHVKKHRLAAVHVIRNGGGLVAALLDVFRLVGRSVQVAQELHDVCRRPVKFAQMEPKRPENSLCGVRHANDRLSAAAMPEVEGRFHIVRATPRELGGSATRTSAVNGGRRVDP